MKISLITNPPYLARNKCIDKYIFNLYGANDLFRCFLLQLINDVSLGGILIVPLNFFSGVCREDKALRIKFFKYYDVYHINIFEEKVFEDTSCGVCSFLFKKKTVSLVQTNIHIYPENKKFIYLFNTENNFGFDNLLNLKGNSIYTINRLNLKNCSSISKTLIKVQCIDNIKSKINAYISNTDYIDTTKNFSCRAYMSLLIEPPISLSKQNRLVSLFNIYLEKKRKKYYSLFLPQYRCLGRKRISFQLVYRIIKHLINDLD